MKQPPRYGPSFSQKESSRAWRSDDQLQEKHRKPTPLGRKEVDHFRGGMPIHANEELSGGGANGESGGVCCLQR